MQVKNQQLESLLRRVSNVTRSNMALPKRSLAIEALVVAELFVMGSTPPADASFGPWYTLNIRPMAISVVDAVNEDYTIDITRVLSLTESAFRGVHQQLTANTPEVVMSLLSGNLRPSLPPEHCEMLGEYLKHYSDMPQVVGY